MMPEDKWPLVIKHLRMHLENLVREKRAGLKEYHFCHPQQLQYAKMKDIEIEECKIAIQLAEGIE